MRQDKRFEYAVGVDETGLMYAEGGAAMQPSDAWTPEHLLLGGLARCTLAALRYHAKRAGAVATGRLTASGAVTRRDEDGRYALSEAHVGLDVAIDPEPADLDLLLAKAERDCFVGASLRIAPAYAWRVNGHAVERPITFPAP